MTDLETLDAAIQTLMVEGIATVTVGGRTVTTKNVNEFLEWRKQLVNSTPVERPAMGARIQKITRTYT